GFGDDEAAQLARAVCHLRAAEALRRLKKPNEAVAAIELVLDILRPLRHDSARKAELIARSSYEVGYALWGLGERVTAEARMVHGYRTFQPFSRANPQNDANAIIMSELLETYAEALSQNGRNDLAVISLQDQVEIVQTQRQGARSAHWAQIERNTLRRL